MMVDKFLKCDQIVMLLIIYNKKAVLSIGFIKVGINQSIKNIKDINKSN
jgi:hypothetical protein